MLVSSKACVTSSTAAEPCSRPGSDAQTGGRPLVAAGSGSGKTTVDGADLRPGHAQWRHDPLAGQPLNARQRRWLCGLVFQFQP